MALVIVLGVTAPARAIAPTQQLCGLRDTGLDDGNTSRILAEDRPSDFWKSACSDEPCRAITDVGCVTTSYAFFLQPNTRAYISPWHARYAQRIYRRNVQALGREHPDRIPLYCALLTRVAASVTGDPAHDGRTLVDITDMALRLDRPGNHCFARIVAAVPKNSQTAFYLAWSFACHRHWRTCRRQMDVPG